SAVQKTKGDLSWSFVSGRCLARTGDLLLVRRVRGVCADNAFSPNWGFEQGFLDLSNWSRLRPNTGFCAPAVGQELDGFVARFANRQRLPHLGCICVFARLLFSAVDAC